MKLFIVQFLQPPITSSLFVPNILLTPSSQTPSVYVRSSLNVSDQVSYPNKTASNFTVLHILIFAFLDMIRR
jgi:hypothetical protein